jgi:glycosyltransferase involved in cell wall biosynthesis
VSSFALICSGVLFVSATLSASMSPNAPQTAIRERPAHSIIFLLQFPNSIIPTGASSRILNYVRRLRGMGHRIYFLVPGWSYHPEVLQELVDRGDIDGFSRLSEYKASGFVNAISRLFVVPGIRNRMLRSQQQQALKEILDEVRRRDCDLIVLQQRMYLFAIEELKKRVSVVIDWGDSFALASWRSIKLMIRQSDMRSLGEAIRHLMTSAADESYYPGKVNANLVISQADKRTIDRLSRASELTHLIPLGINFPASSPSCDRVPDRMIFTGWMNFPPNYEAALWFLDRVFPLILKVKPTAQFIIAGANPISALTARVNHSVQVTGEVPDLSLEIARSQIYVAPLVSGSGFKTKVIEAIAAGTYVVGTSYAAEFLTPELRECITVADGPSDLAQAILSALADPEALRPSVEKAQAILRRNYSWDARATDLERIFNACVALRCATAGR